MRSMKSAAVDCGWLREGEKLLVPRLAFPLSGDLPDVVHENNRAARDDVRAEILSGIAVPVGNRSLFGDEPEIVVAEVDRYGIPLRTVVGAGSGLMRSDPYYGEDYLARFYTRHYRNLYRPRRFSLSWFFAEQIRSGQRIFERYVNQLPRRARILDIGCGMGGMLVPFRLAGMEVAGCDYGEEYVGHACKFGLDVRVGGPDVFEEVEPFDLVILSHIVEHSSDPVAFLTQVAGLLKPTGHCHIEVPGLMNLDQWYKGDILEYLQNAHRWHFTAGTLGAVLGRAGMEVSSCDQTIVCTAHRADRVVNATAADGPKVLAEINRLETARSRVCESN